MTNASYFSLGIHLKLMPPTGLHFQIVQSNEGGRAFQQRSPWVIDDHIGRKPAASKAFGAKGRCEHHRCRIEVRNIVPIISNEEMVRHRSTAIFVLGLRLGRKCKVPYLYLDRRLALGVGASETILPRRQLFTVRGP